MTPGTFDIAVVGAGANGLVAATVLARAGLRVLVLESATETGGRSRTVEFAPGFRAAPLGQDPGWLPPQVARELGFAPPATSQEDLGLTVPVETGRFLTLFSDVRRTAEAIRAGSPGDADQWPGFANRMHRFAEFLARLYTLPAPDVDGIPPHELPALAHLAFQFRRLGRTDMIGLLRTLPMSVWELLDDTFESAPLKALVATAGIQDHQQGPRSGGTAFVMLHHRVGAPLGGVRGRTPWREGPDAFTRVATEAARHAGVVFRTAATVERIVIQRDAVAGVVLADGKAITVRSVLSTADPARTLLDWVDPEWLDPEFRLAVANIRHRGCTAFVLQALETLPEVRGLETRQLGGLVSLTPNLVALERAADAAKYGTVSEAPHIEFSVPTILWPELAPANRHVLVARVQYAPYRLRDGTWDNAQRDALAASVTRALETMSPRISERIVDQVVWTPPDLEQQFGLREGAASQGELGLDQILFMRPVPGFSRYATPIARLYLGGAGTHPGPGILGGAGWLAARRILSDRRREGSSRDRTRGAEPVGSR